jgi:hypothetical protein
VWCVDGPVVPDSDGEGEEFGPDASIDAGEGAAAVAFEAELAFEGVEYGLDPLADATEITSDADCFGVHPDDLPPVATNFDPVVFSDGASVVPGGRPGLNLRRTHAFPVAALVLLFVNIRVELHGANLLLLNGRGPVTLLRVVIISLDAAFQGAVRISAASFSIRLATADYSGHTW